MAPATVAAAAAAATALVVATAAWLEAAADSLPATGKGQAATESLTPADTDEAAFCEAAMAMYFISAVLSVTTKAENNTDASESVCVRENLRATRH
jgi:hypothetical protein